MTEKEIIDLLNLFISDSYAGNPTIARNFTIIRDCKKDNFDFVINEAIRIIKKKGRF